MSNLYVVGHPGLYGGAATELHHQIVLWRKAFPEININIIPTCSGFENEPLYKKMIDIGIIYHNPKDYSCINKNDAVINFCSKEYLEDLDVIRRFTDKTIFVNCMTWIFPKEKEESQKNNIKFFLYQRDEVRKDHQHSLKRGNCTADFMTFKPYFIDEDFDFSVKDQVYTNIGRISRQDADKFNKNTLHIYEYIVSPKLKVGHFLGFDERSRKKIGNPMKWIKTYKNQNELSVKDFYNTIDFIVQPTDTTENLPRIGFEAMFSGKPLVVDNRGGWKHLVEHGVTGFLCNHERDFIYYGSRLAYDLDLRQSMAEKALQKAKDLASFEASKESWKKVFEKVYA